jgi:HupE / UreJ protein
VRRSALAVVAIAVLLDARPARAHVRSATFGDVSVDGAAVTWTLRVRVADLVGPELSTGLAAGAGVHDALAHTAAVVELMERGLGVSSDAAPCALALHALAGDASDTAPTVVARFRFACPRADGAVMLRYDLFFAQDALHSGYTKVVGRDGAPTTHVFRTRERTYVLGVARSVWQSMREYFALGVEHIFTGYDHLAFLAALLLGTGLARRSHPGQPAIANARGPAVRAVLQIVTAFTAAHSLTLIVSTLHPGLLGTSWVEPAIAASIFYVGVENLIPRTPRRRWLVVFAFGLVHGLGFSSVLREIGLPARGLVLSLLSFNVGVEVGQLAVVSLVLPLVLLVAGRRPETFERWVLRVGSAAIALAGAIWFALRV